MRSLLHNAWFWFGFALLVLYIVMTEVILPAAYDTVMGGYTQKPDITTSSIFNDQQTGAQSYIVQPVRSENN